MGCPDQVRIALLEILKIGLLNIRAFGWDRQPERCAVEADHLHNLPSILRDFDVEALKYYWNVTRVCFVADVSDLGFSAMEEAWSQIADYLSDSEDSGSC